jgi:hypothetical protein
MLTHRKHLKLKQTTPSTRLGFFILGLFISMTVFHNSLLQAKQPAEVRRAPEELSLQEKEERILKLLAEGDLYARFKNYNLANDTYEEIFLLDSNHVEASKRIDALKKRVLEEGGVETGIIGDVYDTEISTRVSSYWRQVQALIEKNQWGKVRFTLEKLLLLDPSHEKARELHAQLKQAAQDQVNPEQIIGAIQ